MSGTDPYVEYSQVRVVEASPERAVVEQPGNPELGNHVKVRHASALYTLAYEGSRELVCAALGQLVDRVKVELVESEISYTAVGLGLTRCVAEPAGGSWATLPADVEAGRRVELETSAVSHGEASKPVTTLEARWAVTPSV